MAETTAPATTTTAAPAAGAGAPPAGGGAPAAAPAAAPSALGAAAAPADPAKPAVGADGKPVADAAKAPDAAPEIKFTLPEGLKADDPFVSSTLETVKGLAKDLGLNEKQANGALAAYLKATEGDRKANAEYDAEQKAWTAELAKDPKLGTPQAPGPDLKAAGSFLRKAGDVGAAALKDIESMGLGNCPSVVRLLAWAGKQLGEDTVRGSLQDTAPGEKSRASVLNGIYNHPTSPRS